MEIVARINQSKYDIFRWRYELSVPKKLALAAGIACLTGLLAQIRIMLPWSPVPVTGQTFAVLLAGVLLGRWWGGISLALYAGLGVAGVPWFSGWSGGIGYLAGPTGGYIIGFILAALFLGHFTDKYVRSRSFLSMLGLMLFANFVLIYVPGLLQLGLWVNLVNGEPVTLATLLGMGAVPFIAGDVIKAIIAAAIARGVTPKLAYNGEVDKDKWASWRLP
jgi:biotin transport system substrate-specific component